MKSVSLIKPTDPPPPSLEYTNYSYWVGVDYDNCSVVPNRHDRRHLAALNRKRKAQK